MKLEENKKTHIKPLLIFIVIAISALLVFTIYRNQNSQKDLSSDIGGPRQENPAPFSIPDGETFEIAGIEVDNFYKSSEILNVKGDVSISKNSSFEIFYFPETSQFLISITGSSFDEAKKSGENEFVEIAGSKEKACRLNVVITTPRYANPDKAGETFNLSFCK